MLEVILLLIGGYVFTQTAGHCIHWVLHRTWAGPIHISHNDHHRRKYTPKDFLDTKYRYVDEGNSPFIYYAIPAVIFVALGFYLLPFHWALILSVELALVAFANDWIHLQLHIDGHWLERYRWFWRCRDLHWQHHVNEGTNYGIFSFFTDKLFGSFKEPVRVPDYYRDLPKVQRNQLPLVPESAEGEILEPEQRL